MGIRTAIQEDTQAIGALLAQLEHPTAENLVAERLTQLIAHPDHELIVYELNNEVVAFMSIHFIPQIAYPGDFAMVSYFAVDHNLRSRGLGKEMEEHCVLLAKARKCNRIELHSSIRRTAAHRFYERQGYVEFPKYFSKLLVE